MRPRKSKTPTVAGARESALRALSRREHSAAELRHKLAQRGHEPESIAAVVAQLAEAGWQSDPRYAEMLVRNRVEQGYGPLRIRAELSAAGITDTESEAALAAAEVDWQARACEVHARKFKSRKAATPAQWQQQYRFLAARGFEARHIRAVLRMPVDGLNGDEFE